MYNKRRESKYDDLTLLGQVDIDRFFCKRILRFCKSVIWMCVKFITKYIHCVTQWTKLILNFTFVSVYSWPYVKNRNWNTELKTFAWYIMHSYKIETKRIWNPAQSFTKILSIRVSSFCKLDDLPRVLRDQNPFYIELELVCDFL